MDYHEKLCLGYKEAITQLRQHPNIIWTRNNFFLLIQSGLLAFTLNIESRSDAKTRVIVCVAGLFLAFFWLWVNLAGRNLQRLWRGIVLEFEKELFDEEAGEGKVIGPFQRAKEMGEGGLSSVSITLILIMLPASFIILWSGLLVRLYL